MKRFLLITLGVVVLSAAALGCGVEEPGPPLRLDGGGKLDGYKWPDFGGPKYDLPFNYDTYVPPKQDGSTPPGDGGGDGSTPSDGGGTCPGPSGASCSGCPSTHLCTAAKGGTCAKTVVLSGPASSKAVLKTVALAYVECWKKQPSNDTLCSTFDTCNLKGMLTDQMVKNWVCNSAQVSDFPSSAVLDEVKGIVACSFYQTYRPDWKITNLTSGKKADICMSYDVNGWMYYDYLYVDACSKYPPK